LLRAWFLNDLGCVLELQGKRDQAIEVHKQSIALKEKTLGKDHPDIGISEANLAIALQGLGRNEEALSHVERSLELIKRSLGDSHPEMAVSLVDQGEILNVLGRHPDARAAFKRAEVIWQREFGPDNVAITYALTGIGVTDLAEGRPTSAITPLRRAYELRKVKEPEPSRRAETSFALARALWESKRNRSEAVSLAEEAAEGYAKANSTAKASEVQAWLNSRN
jgi:tetratricopeptide (TPR) repeat protein